MASKIPPEPTSLIYLLNKYQRKFSISKTSSHGYYGGYRSYTFTEEHTHQYTVIVYQEGNEFLAAMYSIRPSNLYATNPWKYEQRFDNLAEAMDLTREMILKPHEYGGKNLPGFITIQNPQTETWQPRIEWSTEEDVQAVSCLSEYERPASLDDGSMAARVNQGVEAFEINLAGGELVRQLWALKSETARSALLKYAEEAPFTYGYWSHWKWLYKQAEEAEEIEPALVIALLARLDNVDFSQAMRIDTTTEKIILTERKVSYKTLGYMKRRARRYLRTLPEHYPAQYIEIAGELLEKTGINRTELAGDYQWLAFDIVNAGGDYFYQKKHGRGPYVFGGKRLRHRLPATNLAATWIRHPNVLLPLYTAEKMAWQVQEFALHVLIQSKVTLPEHSSKQNLAFLKSPSYLLIREATSQVEKSLEMGKPLSPENVALAFWYSNAARRSKLARLITNQNFNQNSQAEFCRELASKLPDIKTGRLKSRWLDAGRLLAENYSSLLRPDTLEKLALILLASQKPELQPLIQRVVENKSLVEISQFLSRAIKWLEEAQLKILANIAVEASVVKPVTAYEATLLVINQPERWLREVGWKILAANTQLNLNDIHLVWKQILEMPATDPVVTTAFSSRAALGLLISIKENISELLGLWLEKNVLHILIPEDIYGVLLDMVPVHLLFKLIFLDNEQLWTPLRGRLLAGLSDRGRILEFWKLAWQRLPEDSTGTLHSRLLEDDELLHTWLEVADESFLDTNYPPFGPLLARWLESRLAGVAKGDSLLLAACMSKLMEVRSVALRRVALIGQTTPFALRLLESGLPECIERGKAHFETVPAGDGKELEYATVLCDSPDKTVQAYGREFVESRWENLPAVELLRKLSEHSDPQIQELVAGKLLTSPHLLGGKDATKFDKGILRTHNQGRRVKELVKARLNQAPQGQLDQSILLEMARSWTQRDAEWAFEQLVRLAKSGEIIEGLQVEGVEGI